MVDDDREIPLPFANGDLVEPEPRDTCEQVAAVALLGHHSPQIRPTVRQLIRISSQIAFFDVFMPARSTDLRSCG